MTEQVDVAVVGAGPAGSRVAELLARDGMDVILLDPKAPWEKPCGGGLTPALFEEVPELREVQALARPIYRARIELGGLSGFEVGLDAPIWMISREALGRWQLDRALAAGARHAPVHVRHVERIRSGWLLESETHRVEAAALVGADGAASRVRRSVAPAMDVGLMATRVVYPRGPGPRPDTLLLRFYPDLVGYLWDFPRPDHRSVGIEAAGGSHARPELDGRISAYGARDDPGGGTRTRHVGAVIGTARLGHGDFSAVAGPGYALVGDAAGFADPFTGEGIRNAIRSADLLVAAWRMGGDWHVTYRAGARAAFARDFAVARALQAVLGERGLGVRIVEWALESRLAYAIVTATLNTANVHDYAPRRLVRLLAEAFESRLRPA